MKPAHLPILICLALAAVFVSAATAGANTAADLERKMAEIRLLNDQLTAQKVQAILLREQLYEKKERLRKEIQEEKKRLGIKTFEEAEKSPRIHYNLLLLRELLSYIDGFNERIRYYQIGNDKLAYLLRQSEDELKIVQTLNEMKIEALTSQIELVMAQYLSDAHTIVLVPEDFIFEEPEAIWQKVMKGKI